MDIQLLQEQIVKLVNGLDLINTFVDKAEKLIFTDKAFDGDQLTDEILGLYPMAIDRQMKILDFYRKILHVPTGSSPDHSDEVLTVADFLTKLSKEDFSLIKQMTAAKQNGVMQ